MDALDKALERNGVDAYVMICSSDNADMRYLTHFITTDPVVYIKKKGEKGVIVVAQMEFERASREAIVPVITRAEAGLIRILDEEPDRWRALARMIAEYVKGGVLVPLMFPYGLGIGISEYTRVMVDKGTIGLMRAIKQRDEIVSIQHVQTATEAAMEYATALIRSSVPKKGILFRGEVPLTSEAVQLAIRDLLQKKGCYAQDTIVSCGKDSALPHIRGSGPLYECEPIVIDISPRDEKSGYYSDMTRTISKGIPESEICEMYIAVRDAQDIAEACIKPGILGSSVHQAVVDLFKERGYTSGIEGFTHNLGHGVGLEVHELPTLGPGGEKLVRGNVITNEPGLYYNRLGGVRIEDIGVVSRTGLQSFTHFPRELVI